VRFEAVGFSYRPGHPVLREFSLDVPAGQTVALVGTSGAGKTTVASLMLRFYDPDAGSVRLDGHDVRTLTLASLRRNVALVLQDAVLFGATIAENIAYGRPGATAADIRAAAEAAGAHGFISALSDGYDTAIGERGATLSGGQRQGVAVARAAAWARHVIIMDEPTAALGVKESGQVLELIGRIRERGLPVVLISHNMPHVFEIADRIHIQRLGRRIAVVKPSDHSMSDVVAIMTGARTAEAEA
jgi:ABC-type multidrug transport system fused ATPase/permease subunit